MIKYPSKTKNGGTTIILDSVAQAIDLYQKPWKASCNCKECKAQQSPKTKQKVIDAILSTTFSESELREIEEHVDAIKDSVYDISPSLKAGYDGYKRDEDGFGAIPDLVAQGDDRPCINRRISDFRPKDGTGDGAYRLLICTDVSWWGNANDNLAIVSAFIQVLKEIKPVELWIQQGWLGGNEHDGVTLFKYDFSASFNITQVAFWICSEYKDSPFSFGVNKALGRKQSKTSTVAEIECDLWLRGDWFRMLGISNNPNDQRANKFKNDLFTDKVDTITKWIAKTSFKMIGDDDSSDEIILG